MYPYVGCAALLLMLAWGTAAEAGQTLYLLLDGADCDLFRCPEPRPRLIEVDLDGGRIAREISIPAVSVGPTNLAVTSDGRYLFWADQPNLATSQMGLRIVDATTGYRASTTPFLYEPRFRAHPSKVRAFLPGFQNKIAVVEPYYERSISFPICTTGTFGGISGDGTRTLLNCVDSSSGSLIADAETGTLVNLLSVRFSPAHATLNETGSELFGVEPESIPQVSNTFVFRRLSVATGLELARSTFQAHDGTLFLDRRTGRVFLVTFDEVLAFDPVSASIVGRLPLPYALGYSQMVFDAHRPVAYVLRQHDSGSSIAVIDTDTLGLLFQAPVPYAQRAWGLALAPEPPAPRNLVGTVAGSQVTLSWEHGPRSPMITAFEIEAGSEGGLTNLGRFRTADAALSVVVDGVPPGRYYVRVRGVNYSGSGMSSNEIALTVP